MLAQPDPKAGNDLGAGASPPRSRSVGSSRSSSCGGGGGGGGGSSRDGGDGCGTSGSSPFRMIQCRRPQRHRAQSTAAKPAEACGDAAEKAGSGAYSQLPMRAFMAPKDWRELLTKRDRGKLAKCKQSGNKYNRMLYSYHRLYQEYQYICTCLQPRSRPGASDGGGGCGGAGIADELLIGLEPPAGGGGSGEEAVEQSDAAAGSADPLSTDGFGSVLMADRNFRVRRCKKRRSVVCHRVLTRTADGATVWLAVPIAVELLLPRLQEQIKAVMDACPHVSDPLEVLAELRTSRYDTERCVQYLRESLPLREVVRDILSVRSGRRCPPPPPLQPPPLLSPSPPLTLQPPSLPTSLSPPRALPATAPVFGGGSGGDGFPVIVILTGVRQLKDDLRVVHTSLRSVATAMAAGLGKVRCHLSMQQERARRLGSGATIQQQQQQQAVVARMQKCVDELRHKCKEEEARRRQVFNALQEQLGNIRVYCRCTRIEGDQSVEPVGAETVRVRGCQNQDEFFRFDRVFGPDAPQESLFDELKPLITSFLDGYNVCFITYGGEASGKTFTLLGSSKQRGLVYRALLTVLKEATNRAADWSLELDSACLEIYNDACFDLLADRTAVSLYKDCGLGSVFAALQRAPIREEKDVTDLLRACFVRRRVAKTALNPRSSRSHLIHLVRLQARSRVHGHTACSYLAMMDLAGAENIVKADTWREPERAAEAGHINRSLAAFNRLFLTLRRTPPSAACYREARLTQMLKPFLVNHGKCCIIVTVRTDQASTSTTMSTLRFGRDTRQVALGKAQRQLLTVD